MFLWLTSKVELYESESVGKILFLMKRLPFRSLLRNPDKVMFQPAFPSARWYWLNTDVVDVEKLAACETPNEAMAYLRSIENFDLNEI